MSATSPDGSVSRLGLSLITVVGLLGLPSTALSASSSSQFHLMSDGVVSGGETCAAGRTRVASSVIGEPIANDVATAAFKLSEGHFVVQHQLLFLLPHPAPTVNPVTTPTAISTQTLSGTKTANTSLWLNNVQVVPPTPDTTWSDLVSLAEGSNVLNILTRDQFGNTSATISFAIFLDTTPPTLPVVTDDGAFTSNFTQLRATWTSVDPETGIQVYEYRIGTTPTGSELVPPTSIGLATAVTKTGLTLFQGQIYYIAVRAKNGAGSWSQWGVSDGIYANSSAPVISAFSPADASKFLHGDSVTLSATASDADGDSLEYQFSSNGILRQGWSALTSYRWLTTASNIGLQIIKVEVRDGHGGVATRQQEIYVVRKPVLPPP